MSNKCFAWSELEDEWILSEYQWSDVCIIKKIGLPGNIDMYDYKYVKQKLDKKEEKRFIELACKINGISMTQIKERKNKGEAIVTVKEIKTTMETVLKSVQIISLNREDI
jgi:hypothetical protein